MVKMYGFEYVKKVAVPKAVVFWGVYLFICII